MDTTQTKPSLVRTNAVRVTRQHERAEHLTGSAGNYEI